MGVVPVSLPFRTQKGYPQCLSKSKWWKPSNTVCVSFGVGSRFEMALKASPKDTATILRVSDFKSGRATTSYVFWTLCRFQLEVPTSSFRRPSRIEVGLPHLCGLPKQVGSLPYCRTMTGSTRVFLGSYRVQVNLLWTTAEPNLSEILWPPSTSSFQFVARIQVQTGSRLPKRILIAVMSHAPQPKACFTKKEIASSRLTRASEPLGALRSPVHQNFDDFFGTERNPLQQATKKIEATMGRSENQKRFAFENPTSPKGANYSIHIYIKRE